MASGDQQASYARKPSKKQGSPSSSASSEVQLKSAGKIPTDAPAEQQDVDAEHGDIAPQALDILAGLASLGISDALRVKVQDALTELERASAATSVARQEDGAHPQQQQRSTTAPGQGSASGHKTVLQRLEEAEHKLQMSRSIMRKLYHKNVALEKELQLVKAGQQPLVASQDAWATGSPADSHVSPLRPSTSHLTNGQSGPAAVALQERDRTIQQLQAALDASRRSCAILEAASPLDKAGGSGAGGLGGAAGGGKGYSQESVRQVLAQSSMHFHKYRAIRDDYNRLLNRRAKTVQGGRGPGSAAVRHVVEDLQQRLHSEVAEREAEAALYSARLYESERQHSDWYVEKRMLQDQIAKLSEAARERDKLDNEIETCVCGLFERLRLLEATNEELLAKVGGSSGGGGGSSGGNGGSGGGGGGTPASSLPAAKAQRIKPS